MRGKHQWRGPLALIPLAGLLAATALGQSNVTRDAVFESKVRPVLIERCQPCHSARNRSGNLRLDQALPSGLAPKLVRAIRREGGLAMPPNAPLSEPERRTLEDWAQSGAYWPAKTSVAVGPSHWAFQRVRRPLEPPVAVSGIDAFIQGDLEKHQLAPAPLADRTTLIRRVTFDLTGLPPTAADVAAFLADTRPDAYAHVVDRLLASPRYGEKWGRHWLDLVRYADSLDARGLGSEGDISEAWRYRDWVVGALNADLPYDRFVQLQVAGDVLTPDDPAGIVATGLLAIGNWGNGDADKDKILTDIVDDQIDVVSKSVLGLTVGCARCHDHKFDPISQKDYYALAGIFMSSHILPRLTPKGQGEVLLRVPIETAAERQLRAQIAEKEKARDSQRMAARTAIAQGLAAQAEPVLVQLAAQSPTPPAGVPGWAWERWREFLGLRGPLTLTTPFKNLADVRGIDGVKGAREALSATINTTDQAQRILTFTLPPRSVNLHPSPSEGVGVIWTAPQSGLVAITGSVADADPACGNGVLWELRLSGKVADSGRIDNGGKATLPTRMLTVTAGESVTLAILPNQEYSCDTTTVALQIKTVGGGPEWDLTQAALAAPGQGQFGPWRFVDLAAPKRSPQGEAVVAAFAAGKSAEAARLAEALPRDQNPFFPITDDVLPAETRTALAALDQEIVALRQRVPSTPQLANAVQEGGVPGSPQEGIHDSRIHRRGRYDMLGDVVPRGVPEVVAGKRPPKIANGSGRRELAQWLTQPENPLTARVIVNRVWHHHFGAGLVRTPSNFGALGERPTNAALLDWLATTFIQDDHWSLKKLHRRIVLSQTYRRSSIVSPQLREKDPENRFWARMNRRRLEAEEVRDSLLAAAGVLDTTPGGVAFAEFETPRRTLYLRTIRSDRTGFGPLFDLPDSTASVEKRVVSTVAPQALYLLNHPFVLQQAARLAQALVALPGTDAARVTEAYQRCYGRRPTANEAQLGLSFLRGRGGDKDAWEAYCQILLCANEFIYVD